MQKKFADVDQSPKPVVTNYTSPEEWRQIYNGVIQIDRSIKAHEAQRKSRGTH